jgi:acetolactate synthase I/II/III large subunit
VDLVAMFKPVSKWADTVRTPAAIPEMVRNAFKTAQSERPGVAYLAVPQDVEPMAAPSGATPLKVNRVHSDAPSPAQIARAAAALQVAKRPILLAGHGAARNGAQDALVRFAEKLGIPVATTFHGKGVIPDDHPNALGAIGFMVHDYTNFGFDQADLVISVGYELQEFPPLRINPEGDKTIIHIHRFPAVVDAHYNVDVGIEGDIAAALDALAAAVSRSFGLDFASPAVRAILKEELDSGQADDSFPVKPQRLVADIRAAMGRDDIVLADTGLREPCGQGGRA